MIWSLFANSVCIRGVPSSIYPEMIAAGINLTKKKFDRSEYHGMREGMISATRFVGFDSFEATL